MKVKLFVSAVLLMSFVLGFRVDGSGKGIATYITVWEHAARMLIHDNVWHLAGNLLVLWLMRMPLYLMIGMLIGFVCSWLPVLPGVWELLGIVETTATSVTVGFSGVLFAIIGVKWGKACCDGIATYVTVCKKLGPVVVAGAFLPYLNWCLHLYCLLAGLVYGRMRSAGN